MNYDLNILKIALISYANGNETSLTETKANDIIKQIEGLNDTEKNKAYILERIVKYYFRSPDAPTTTTTLKIV